MRRRTVVTAILAGLALAAVASCARRGASPAAVDASVVLEEGLRAVDRRDLPAARRAIRTLRDRGDDDRARILRARALLARGFLQAGIESLPAEPESRDGRPDPQMVNLVRVVLGEAAYKARDYPRAERELAAVLATDPGSIAAHRLLGAMYYDAGVVPAAIRHLEETARLDPADHRPSRLLGLVHNDYERYGDAVGHYEESLRRAPDQPDRDDVLGELASCQVKLRRHRDALATLAAIGRATPASEALRAECLLAVGRRDEGAAIVDRLLAESPDDLGALVLDGTIRLEDGDAAGAVAPLERAVAGHPLDYLARLSLARALAGSGREEEAAAARAEAERIRALRREFADLHQAAWDAPGDAAVRRRLAAMAAELGRPDLERVWLEAAEAVGAAR